MAALQLQLRSFASAVPRGRAAARRCPTTTVHPGLRFQTTQAQSTAGEAAFRTQFLFNSMEQSQESMALTHRNRISEQLLQEVEKRKDVFFPDQGPTARAKSFSGAYSVEPHKLLQRILRRPTDPPLTAAVAESLVGAIEKQLSELTSPVIDLDIPKEGADPRLVVVGDTHGQLADVLHILQQQGPPSDEVAYLFNGDIVDRGPNAVEIWLLLLAFKLAHPERVHVLRGNHENDQMIFRPGKSGGGFSEECLSKYGHALLLSFQRLFKLLPLFAVLQKEVFVVHGGLFRTPGVDLPRLRALPQDSWRRNYPNPLSAEQLQRGEQWTDDETIIFDAQWADPHRGSGFRPCSRGKVAVSFGEDVTHSFLDDAGLALCIRSHRVPNGGRGFEIDHSGRLITLFSASRYGGICRNRGAIAVLREKGSGVGRARNGSLNEPELAPLKNVSLKLLEHDIDPNNVRTDPSHAAADTATQVRRIVEQMAREHQSDLERHAIALICSEREVLLQRCRALDVEGRGKVCKMRMIEVLMEVCGDIGWPQLLARAAPHLGVDVAYGPFLSTPQVRWFHLGPCQVVQVARASAQAELQLTGLHALFDCDLNGLVTPPLQKEALRQLLPTLRPHQTERLATALFGEDSCHISSALHRLALFADPPVLTEPWMQPALRWLAGLVERHHGGPPLHSALIRFFRSMAPDGSGLVQPEQFVRGFQSIGAFARDTPRSSEVPALHTGRLYKLFEVIDANRTGTISFLELLLALDERVDRPKLPNFPAALEGQLPAQMLIHKAALLQLCQLLDPEEEGTVSVANFVELISLLCDVLGRPLSADLRASIEQELGTEDLPYADILGSFDVMAEGWSLEPACCDLELAES